MLWRPMRLVPLAVLFCITQCSAYNLGPVGVQARLRRQAQQFFGSWPGRRFALPVFHAVDGDAKRATKADVDRIRRIEELRQESQTLLIANRNRRDRDAEHIDSQLEAADGIAACHSLLKQAETSAKAAQVACMHTSGLRIHSQDAQFIPMIDCTCCTPDDGTRLHARRLARSLQ